MSVINGAGPSWQNIRTSLDVLLTRDMKQACILHDDSRPWPHASDPR